MLLSAPRCRFSQVSASTLNRGLAGARVYEDVGAFVVLDLQGEVVGVALGRERLLALV
jgi:hypothetical protein